MPSESVVPFARPGPGTATGSFALTGAAPLRLDSDDVAGWLVERGRVDLFAVALRDGMPAGPRLPLCRIEAGGLIASLPPCAEHTIIAAGQLDTVVVPLVADPRSGHTPADRAELIDGWLAAVAAVVFGEAPAWPEFVAEPGDRIEVPAGRQLYAGRRPVWLTARCGDLALADDGEPIRHPVPIAAGLAVRAVEDCVVAAACTAEILADGSGGSGLDRFHAAVLTALGERLAEAEAAGRRRIAGRSAADRRSIDWAVRRLAGVVGRAETGAARSTGSDPLIAALMIVAERLGVGLTRMPRAEARVGAPLRAIARANGIGLREVLLRGEWWRGDHGPLLAWRGDERRPVALLPARRGYRLWDPAAPGDIALDSGLAAEIGAAAVMIYRPAPTRIGGLWGLLRFAARGVGGEVSVIAGAAAFGAALAMAVPFATGYLLDSAVPRAEVGQVAAVIAALLLAGLGGGIFDLTKAIALLRLEARLEAATQPALMHRLLSLPVNFFRGFGTGDLTSRVLSIQTMRQLLAGNALLSLLSAAFAGASLLVILFYSPPLALISAGLVLIAALLTGGLAWGELRQERARVGLRGQESNLVIQVLQGIAKLRVAAAERRLFAQWAGLFSRQKRRFRQGRRYAAAAEAVAEVYPILALLVLYLVVTKLLTAGNRQGPALDLGAFLAINAAFGQLFAATMTMARTVAATLEIVPLFERLRPIVAATPEAVGDRLEAAPLAGRIEISQLSFRYAAGTALVLDDLSLTIEPGQFVAVVGPSGGGKSTLLRLLLGFEQAERGDILYDGQSISVLDTASLRRQIGVVLQQGRIMTGSIFDNITAGLPYTLDDAREAARLAGIDNDIDAMPMGMHTLLMEGTSTLSGGQRQRLMLARALIGRPRILLFDEATSALDNRSQAVVTQSLARLRTTRIVIAHRLSTVQQADRIAVIERGRLVETGTFDELVGRNGAFTRLARRQIL